MNVLNVFVKVMNKSTEKSVFNDDQRAVSVSVDHALGLFILLIISGVFVSGVSSSFDEREQLVTEKELERVTDEVANSLVHTDSLVAHGEAKHSDPIGGDEITVSSRVSVSSVLTQQGVTVTVGSEGEQTVITSSSGDVEVEQRITLENDVEDFGGSGVMIIEYDGDVLTLRSE